MSDAGPYIEVRSGGIWGADGNEMHTSDKAVCVSCGGPATTLSRAVCAEGGGDFLALSTSRRTEVVEFCCDAHYEVVSGRMASKYGHASNAYEPYDLAQAVSDRFADRAITEARERGDL